MKKAMIFSFLLISSFNMTAQDSDYLTDFKQKWKNAAEYTIEFAEMMPEEHFDYKPTDDVRTFKEQLLHIVANMTWLSSDYLEGGNYDQDLKSTEYTKTEVIQILKEGFRFAANAVDHLEPHDLRNKVEFFAGPMNVRQILTLMNDHVTHHRGQIIVYFRLKGLKPPKYRGW